MDILKNGAWTDAIPEDHKPDTGRYFMPDYIYTDGNHTQNVTHSMAFNGQIVCTECSAVMWRKPQPFRVSWGGLAPSAGGIPSLAQELNDTRAEREEKYWRAKDGRG